jgi:hypothetical protein
VSFDGGDDRFGGWLGHHSEAAAALGGAPVVVGGGDEVLAGGEHDVGPGEDGVSPAGLREAFIG